MAALAVFWCSGLSGQELPLKRSPAPLTPDPCEVPRAEIASATSPTLAAAAEADRLASEANQAAILGDNVLARALLREAVRLDPTSELLRYRLGRLLDDTGEAEEALAEYCRFLALDPIGAEVTEVERRLAENPIFAARAVEMEANEAFLAGIESFDDGRSEAAAQEFSRAIILRSDWEAAHYNRGVAYLEIGRLPAAAADLEWYLELLPDAEDRTLVQARLAAMEPEAPPMYNPNTALVTGILLPGMGHVYSGRPGLGLLVLAAAAGSAAAGIAVKEVQVTCRGLPVNGDCPANLVVDRQESRPWLIPGLAGAAAVTIGGALHAYFSARGSDSFAASLLSPRGSTLGMTAGRLNPHLSVAPVARPGGTGWRATAEFRF